VLQSTARSTTTTAIVIAPTAAPVAAAVIITKLNAVSKQLLAVEQYLKYY